MKVTPAMILDTIFTAFVSFILSFVVFFYFFERRLAITFAVTFSLLFTLFAFRKFFNKHQKIKLSNEQKKLRDDAQAQLNVFTTTEKNDLFECALSNAGYQTARKRGGILIKDKKTYIFPLFSVDGVNKTDVVKIFNSIGREDTAYIISANYLSGVKEFADRFDGRIITCEFDGAFKFLYKNDALPRQKFKFKEKTPLKLSAIKNIVHKKNSKKLLLFGLGFLFMSYFVSIKTYYVICGSIFLFLALFCKLFGKEEVKTVTN